VCVHCIRFSCTLVVHGSAMRVLPCLSSSNMGSLVREPQVCSQIGPGFAVIRVGPSCTWFTDIQSMTFNLWLARWRRNGVYVEYRLFIQQWDLLSIQKSGCYWLLIEKWWYNYVVSVLGERAEIARYCHIESLILILISIYSICLVLMYISSTVFFFRMSAKLLSPYTMLFIWKQWSIYISKVFKLLFTF